MKHNITKNTPKYALHELQPSQFYISSRKLKAVENWFDRGDLSSFEPIPIKLINGKPVMTDGHTRAVAAIKAGLLYVPLVWEDEELDWYMYKKCVEACVKMGINSPALLADRVISDSEYRIKWHKWCDEMHAEVLKKRETNNKR